MKRILNWIASIYCQFRRWAFSRESWKAFATFAKLPEMKISKTIGFIVSILL